MDGEPESIDLCSAESLSVLVFVVYGRHVCMSMVCVKRGRGVWEHVCSICVLCYVMCVCVCMCM